MDHRLTDVPVVMGPGDSRNADREPRCIESPPPLLDEHFGEPRLGSYSAVAPMRTRRNTIAANRNRLADLRDLAA